MDVISLYPAPSLIETQDRLSLVDIHNLLAVVVISRLTSPPPHPHPYPAPPPPTLSTPTPPPPAPPPYPPPPTPTINTPASPPPFDPPHMHTVSRHPLYIG